MPGIDLAAFAERIRTLNAPDQGMNYRGAHSGERRYNELDGKEYYTRGEPATLTVYGDRAQLLYDLIRNCAEIADALSTPVAQGDEVRDALEDIAAERERQISAEGWTPEHDDEHHDGSLAKAAACYARGSRQYWPWDRMWWKPRGKRANLVRAGALIVAEIERLDRVTLTKGARDAG